jgi:hypothetical protein
LSRRNIDAGDERERPRPGESFLQRFHRLKTEARSIDTEDDGAVTADRAIQATEPAPSPEAPEPTDADMPPLASLGPDSDYTGFLSAKVSESLRRAALRKLFHSAQFNVTDGLDEYADDFTTFESLGNIVTADMRHSIETELRRKAEAAEQALSDDGTEDDVTETPADREQTAGAVPTVAAAPDEPQDRSSDPTETDTLPHA